MISRIYLFCVGVWVVLPILWEVWVVLSILCGHGWFYLFCVGSGWYYLFCVRLGDLTYSGWFYLFCVGSGWFYLFCVGPGWFCLFCVGSGWFYLLCVGPGWFEWLRWWTLEHKSPLMQVHILVPTSSVKVSRHLPRQGFQLSVCYTCLVFPSSISLMVTTADKLLKVKQILIN